MLTRGAYRKLMGLPEKTKQEPVSAPAVSPKIRRRSRSVVNNVKNDDKNIRISLEIKIDNSNLTNQAGPVPIVFNFGDFMKSMDLNNLVNNGATINLSQGMGKKLMEMNNSSPVALSPSKKVNKSIWQDESSSKKTVAKQAPGREKAASGTVNNVNDSLNKPKRKVGWPKGKPRKKVPVQDNSQVLGAEESPLAINPGANDLDELLSDSFLNTFDDLVSNEDLTQGETSTLEISNNDHEGDENRNEDVPVLAENDSLGEVTSSTLVDQDVNSDPGMKDTIEAELEKLMQSDEDCEKELELEKNLKIVKPELEKNNEKFRSRKCSVVLMKCDDSLKKEKDSKIKKMTKKLDEDLKEKSPSKRTAKKLGEGLKEKSPNKKITKKLKDVWKKNVESPCKKITKQLKLKDYILTGNSKKINDKKIDNDLNVENEKNSDLQDNSYQEAEVTSTAVSIDEAYESHSEMSLESFESGRIIDNIISRLASSEEKNSNGHNKEEEIDLMKLIAPLEVTEMNNSAPEHFENENVEDFLPINYVFPSKGEETTTDNISVSKGEENVEKKMEENGVFLDFSVDITENKPDFEEIEENDENFTCREGTGEKEAPFEEPDGNVKDQTKSGDEEKDKEIVAYTEGAKEGMEESAAIKHVEKIVAAGAADEEPIVEKIGSNLEDSKKLEEKKINSKFNQDLNSNKKILDATPVIQVSSTDTDSDSDSVTILTSGKRKILEKPAKNISSDKTKPNSLRSLQKRTKSSDESDSDSDSSSSSCSEKIKKSQTPAKKTLTKKSKPNELKSCQKKEKSSDDSDSDSDSSSSSSSSSEYKFPTLAKKISSDKPKPDELKSCQKRKKSSDESDSDSGSDSSSSSEKVKKFQTSGKGTATEKSKSNELKFCQKKEKSSDDSDSDSDSSFNSEKMKKSQTPAKEISSEKSKPDELKSCLEGKKPSSPEKLKKSLTPAKGSDTKKITKSQTPAKGSATEKSKPNALKSCQQKEKPSDDSDSDSDSSSEKIKISQTPAKVIATEKSRPNELKSCQERKKQSTSEKIKKLPAEGTPTEKYKPNELKTCQRKEKSSDDSDSDSDSSFNSEKMKKSETPGKEIPSKKSKPDKLKSCQEKKKPSSPEKFKKSLTPAKGSSTKKIKKSQTPAKGSASEKSKPNEPKSCQKKEKSSDDNDSDSDSSSNSGKMKKSQAPAKEISSEKSKPDELKSCQERKKPSSPEKFKKSLTPAKGSATKKIITPQTPAKGSVSENSKPNELKSCRQKEEPSDDSDSDTNSSSGSEKLKKSQTSTKEVPSEKSKPDELKSCQKRKKPSSPEKLKKSLTPAKGSATKNIIMSQTPAKGSATEKSKPKELKPCQQKEKPSDDRDSDTISSSELNKKSRSPTKKILPEKPKLIEPRSFRSRSSSSDLSISDPEQKETSKSTIVLRKRKEREKNPDLVAELDKTDEDFSPDEDVWEPPKVRKKPRMSAIDSVSPGTMKAKEKKEKKSKLDKKATIDFLNRNIQPKKKSNENEFPVSDNDSILSVEKDDLFENSRNKKIKKRRKKTALKNVSGLTVLSKNNKKLQLLDALIQQEMQKYRRDNCDKTDWDCKSEVSVLDLEEIQRSCLEEEMIRRSFSKPSKEEKSSSSLMKTEESKKKDKSKKSKTVKMEKTDIDISPLPKSISSQLKTVKPTFKVPQKPAKKPKRKAEEPIPTPHPSKKVSSDDYIPLKVDGPTKFGVSNVNKLSKAVPYKHHTAADFKARMLDRVKRIPTKKLISLKEKRNQLK